MAADRARRRVVVLAVVSVGALIAAWLFRPSGSQETSAETRPDGGDPVPAALDGKAWEILSVNGRPADAGFGAAPWFRFSNSPPPDVNVIDPIDGARYVDGHNNCNQYSGSVRFDSDRITEILAGTSTLMACPPPQFGPVPGLVELDRDWMVIRGEVTVVAFDRSRPTPTGKPPAVAEVDSPMPSEPVSTVAAGTVRAMPENWAARAGSRWILTSVNGVPWTSSLVPSLTIGTDTVFSGHDGCHRYVGSWWLADPDIDDRLVVFASEPEEHVPCRAVVEPLLRPADGFRFTVSENRLVSGPFAAQPDGSLLPSPTLADGSQPSPSAEPFVVFEPLGPGERITDAQQLTGEWATLDDITVSFDANGTVSVGDCGPVAEWRLDDRLTIEQLWPSYPTCDVVNEPSLAMLLLDTRTPEQLELLDDGRLIHTSDTALTILQRT